MKIVNQPLAKNHERDCLESCSDGMIMVGSHNDQWSHASCRLIRQVITGRIDASITSSSRAVRDLTCATHYSDMQSTLQAHV